MFSHKHFFISYGRKESLAFAGRLHQWFALNGHEAWFDKVNIPSGDDYQERINAGIRDAQSFLFVMAPHSLTSPYCYAELEYALSLGKRIFPIMHIEEKPEQIAGYTADQKTVREKVFAIVGKRDWLMAREKQGDLKELLAWKLFYENSWPAHDDSDYLEKWECPIKWDNIDRLEEAASKLVKMSKRHSRHVELHTRLLEAAYEWDLEGRPTGGLLVGDERINAENWLLDEFREELQPCEPTILQAQYIVASKKNGDNMMTEAFLAFAKPESQILLSVERALTMRGISTWLYFHDVEPAQGFLPQIKEGIEQSDNMLFFLSNASLSSKWCLWELKYAFSLNKRVIPLKIGSTEGYQLPDLEGAAEVIERLLAIRAVDFTDNEAGKVDELGKSDFERDIDDVIRELSRDKEYYEQHKKLLVQAIRWENDPQIAYLLRGHNLDNALTWLRVHDNAEENPPVEAHKRFILESGQQRGLHPSELFISYSRKDSDFARDLNHHLQVEGRITWFDQESIASGVDFDQAIFEGIDKADNFLFVISPDSVASKFCDDELIYAASLGKRFIPILLEESDEYASLLPEAYKNTQWIDFKAKGFDQGFQDLILLLDTDKYHVRGHAEWQRRALDWERSDRNSSHLLNAAACQQAEEWLHDALSGGGKKKKPEPTELQEDFIQTSRQVINESQHRLRSRLRNAQIAVGFAMILALIAGWAFWRSTISEKLAQAQLLKVREANQSTVELLLVDLREKRDEMAYNKAIALLRNAKQIGVLKEAVAKEYVEFIFYYAMMDSSQLATDLVNQYSELLDKKLPPAPQGIENLSERYQSVNNYIKKIAGKEEAQRVNRVYLPEMIVVKGGTTMPMDDSFGSQYYTDLQDLRVAESEVTVAQYSLFAKIMGESMPFRPSFGWRQHDPIVNIDWFASINYCNYLSKVLELDTVYTITQNIIQADWMSNGVRLPTEVEWEYAARGGREWRNTAYAGSNDIEDVAWYRGNTNRTGPRNVMTKAPNELGLYDMSGNVYEWCWDTYSDHPIFTPQAVKKLNSNKPYVSRGGSWYYSSEKHELRDRNKNTPTDRYNDLGFRPVRSLE